MTRFGIDKVIYHCPRINKDVLIELYYGIYRGEKVYISIECEYKNSCDPEGKNNWQLCPAYKKYITGDYH